MKSEAQTITAETIVADQRRARRENAGPAGGLLIAVGASLMLWAIIAQVARMLSHFL